MKKFLTIFIGFLHDFAAGCWAATLMTMYWLNRVSVKTPGLQSELTEIKKDFFYIGLVCAAIVILAGTGRTFTYVGNVYGIDAERLRRKMLLIKHLVLISVFGAGIYWQYLSAF